ncbi:MAG: mechanosensitive ion channel family protein, partial [Halomonas sp.]|nr:mechanosensitive ion channel family protein [Halomonas sp.]
MPDAYRLFVVVRGLLTLLLLTLLLSTAASAQSTPLSALTPGGGDEPASHDPQAFQASLDEVIATLEDADQRQALLENLRQLQQAHDPAAEESGITRPQGLLGALAETISDLGAQAEAGRSPVDEWQRQLRQGGSDLVALVVQTGNAELLRFVIELTVLLVIWAGLLVILIALGRLLAKRRGWPLD